MGDLEWAPSKRNTILQRTALADAKLPNRRKKIENGTRVASSFKKLALLDSARKNKARIHQPGSDGRKKAERERGAKGGNVTTMYRKTTEEGAVERLRKTPSARKKSQTKNHL